LKRAKNYLCFLEKILSPFFYVPGCGKGNFEPNGEKSEGDGKILAGNGG